MKKIISISILILIFCLLFIPNYCHAENDSLQTKSMYTQVRAVAPAKVVFQNEDKVIKQEVEVGKKLKEPSHLEIEGFSFEGWYDGEHKWDFENDVVADHLTLVAKYRKIEKRTGDAKGDFINTSINPVTGDGILVCVCLMVVSVFCVIVIKIYTKKKMLLQE